jgi:uncharacterized protein YndB with AHSA1/START domain
MITATDLKEASDRELLISRVFDAPPALIFKIWTQPQIIRQWWGPRGYTTLSSEMDVRPGGAWRVRSRDTDGFETAERGVFREVTEPERLVFTHAWEGEDGTPGHETLVTVTFADQGDKTRMTFRQGPFTSVEIRDGHFQGWSESFDMLVEYLADA